MFGWFASGNDRGFHMSTNIHTIPTQLSDLHDQVLRRQNRVELVDGQGESCVLIAKSELDALEKALAILSETDDAREMRQNVARVAFESMPRP
jgi:PHD/YefM family antitoxin component YafN of YafNO toxin-antitoxin module